MILITDGGSTKCDWVLLNKQGTVVFKTCTEGLNPAILSESELKNRIFANSKLLSYQKEIEKVDFYGAGCGTENPKEILKKVLGDIFLSASITVSEDTLAAVRATTNLPGIVCILGTGSNSCFYDGEKVIQPVDSLGYSIMDEASGNYFGKQLLRDYYYDKMPSKIAKRFSNAYNLSADEIKRNLYKKPNPNMYLASFAEFIFNSENESPFSIEDSDSYFYSMVKTGIDEFIKCRILNFKEATQFPVHFVGSIAYFSREIIKDCFKPHKLQLGEVVKRPIDGLILYYQSEKLKNN